jgi:hypothetical protein
MSHRRVSAVQWVAEAFPVDGPHTPERAIEAARVLGELVRYLAHATYPGRAVRYAPDAYAVLGGLASAAHSLTQVCDQLTDRLAALTTDPSLRADTLGTARPPIELAARAAERSDAARVASGVLAGCLDSAHAAVSRLYHHQPEDHSTGPRGWEDQR